VIPAFVLLLATAGDRLETAKQLVKAGQFASAASELTTLVESSPSALAYNLLGYCYAQQHVTSSAEESFKKAIALDPEFKPAHRNLAGLYLVQGKPREAIAELSTLIRLDSSDARAFYDLGRAELTAGDIRSACEHLQRAHDLLPNDVNTATALARAHQENSDYPAALKTLTQIGEQNTPEWHAIFGYSSYRSNRPEVAITELQKAIALDPRDQDYLLELAEVLLANYNAPAAIALLEPATKAFPDSPRLWFALGVSRMLNDDLRGAASALQASLRLDPKLDLAYVVLGRGYLNAGEWTELLATARTLLSVNPQNAAGYYYQAVALLRTHGEEREIEALLRKSVTLDPVDPDPRYELGKLLLHKKDKQAALAEFEAIVRANPDYGQAYYQLSRLYQANGDTANAQQAEKEYERLRERRGQPVQKLLVNIRQPRGDR
jgi:tetratricopeptide (TPR) repeat protein